MDPRVGYCSPFFFAATLIFIVSLFTYRRRKVRGAWYLTFLCMAASFWATTEGLLYLGLDIKINMLITKLQYLGIAPLSPLALLFSISFFGYRSLITRTRIVLLFLIAMTIIILVWTNSLHNLIFTGFYTIDTGPFPMLGLKHGLMWWMVIVYHYFLLAALSIILLHQAVTTIGFHRSQARLLLSAVAAVWVTNGIYVSGNSPIPNMDIGPIAFVMVAGAMAWGFFRYSLLDILPIAKSEIFRGLNHAIIVLDKKNRVIDMNPAAESLFSINPDNISGQEARHVFNKYPEVCGIIDGMKFTEIRMFSDGHEHIYDMHISPLEDKGGILLGQVITISDITGQKLVEEALRKSEEQFRNVYETAPLAFVVWDKNRHILDWNKKAEDIFGWSKEEVVGKDFFDFIIPEISRTQVEDVVNIFLEDKCYSHSINENITKNGKIITCEWNNSTLHNDDGKIIGAISLALDITQRREGEKALRENEEKLARSKHMESLGLLAGGVAHDLNNILSGIVSYPELILMDLPHDSKLRKPIETMQQSGHRAAAIVEDLLTVARGVAITKETLDLNELVSDYLCSPEFKTLQQFHPVVTIKTRLDTELFIIEGSPVHIRKIVMNLISNAAEAIEGCGHVTITTENRFIDSPLKGYDDVIKGEYVVLSVADEGSGISSHDLERIFEPFYTKKIMGRSGTGLGLAMVWNTVKDHKGYIDVTSDESGTIFQVYFPISRNAISDKSLAIPIEEFKGDGETILVVDDMESQRDLSCEMLEALGYKATAVPSGEAAVEYFKDSTADLILLDMIMDSGINGRETYERIIKLRPYQKAIITSGFAETDDVKKAQELGAGKYIKKPLTLEKMGIAVREELKK
jgi:PAS domain S-box-containing protein